ncbi:MAG: type II toxin-antitoxin system RelE/ParE family toxin [Thermoleophilaceae bacterium]
MYQFGTRARRAGHGSGRRRTLGRWRGCTGSSDPPLPFPWSSQVEGELRELRCHYGSELEKVLYRRTRNLFVLLHMLRKDSGKLPRADIELAKKRWDDFKARMDADRRLPPRAAGQGAP